MDDADTGPTATALIRRRSAHGEADLEILVLPLDAPPDEPADWEAHRAHSVDALLTYLRPDGPDPDPWVSVAHRVDLLLQELGWSRTGGQVRRLQEGRPVRVPVRRAARFRAQLLQPAPDADADADPGTGTAADVGPGGRRTLVTVMSAEGDVMAGYDLGDRDAEAVLAANGWHVDGPSPGWGTPTLAVRPQDWTTILTTATRRRATAQDAARRADDQWRIVLREAVLDGQDVRHLARIAAVTPQRVYQIRDRRR